MPLDPHTRAAILTDITTGQLSRNAIARKHNVASSTVGAIAQAEGHADAFDRTATKNATQAAQVDSKARRVALSKRLLDRAEEALDQMDQPHLVFKIGGKDNVYTEHELDLPPTGDMRNLMIIAATAIDKHIVLERYDSDDQNLSAFDAFLRTMMYGDTDTDPTTGDGQD